MTRPFPSLLIAGCLLGLAACANTPRQSPSPEQQLAAALARASAASAGNLQNPDERETYNQAVAKVVAAWQQFRQAGVSRRDVATGSGPDAWRMRADWSRELLFDELIEVRARADRRLHRTVEREGVGMPFVARWHNTPERKKRHPFMADTGYLATVTVTVDFPAGGTGPRRALLRIQDPLKVETVPVRGGTFPLAADHSAVSEYILEQNASEGKKLGMPRLGALRDSGKYMDKLGLLTLEPPARDRTPVIFVHGLMSHPLTWQNAFNELGADPLIRKHYQMYFFRYPSGVPVIYSSTKLREHLQLLHRELERIGNTRRADRMVLVGHSMGGLVSKMQIVNKGDQVWLELFGGEVAESSLPEDTKRWIQEQIDFKANENVDRVIFISTPHRGSELADGFLGFIAGLLVKVPSQVLFSPMRMLRQSAPAGGLLHDLAEKGIPTSVENLSPESIFIRESVKLPFKPDLQVHSIIGNKSGRPLTDPKCSDGVVPYWSAHLDEADSELVVRAGHDAHETEQAIAEIRRILLLHLRGS